MQPSFGECNSLRRLRSLFCVFLAFKGVVMYNHASEATFGSSGSTGIGTNVAKDLALAGIGHKLSEMEKIRKCPDIFMMVGLAISARDLYDRGRTNERHRPPRPAKEFCCYALIHTTTSSIES